MSASDCIAAIVKASGRDMTLDEVDGIVTEVERQIKTKIASGMSPRLAGAEVGKEMVGKTLLAAMIERRSAALNKLADQALDARVTIGKEWEAVRAVTTGIEGSGRDMGRSIDARRHALADQVSGALLGDLRKSGLLDVMKRRDKAFDRDIAREMSRIDSPDVKATGNKQAEQVAGFLSRANEAIRAAMNGAGAWVGKLDGYITRQSHDMFKVRGDGTEVAFATWRDNILPKLDDRTFDGMESTGERNGFLRATWNALSSGVHDTSTSEALAGFKGPGNAAKKASQERSLHFKDADAWMDYNEVYGKGGLLDSVAAGIRNGARTAALMETLGTNPELGLSRWIDRMTKAAAERSDFAAIDGLKKTGFDMKVMDTLTGKASMPGNHTLASIANGYRLVEQTSKLGGSMLSSIPDLAVNAAMLRHNGIGLFESMGKQITGLVGQGPAAREIADDLAVGVHGMISTITSRLGSDDGIPGKMAHAAEIFHKLNLLTQWTDSLKSSAGLMLSANLGRRAGTEFDALPGLMQTTLRRYGIEDEEWNAARSSPLRAADGRDYMLPSEMTDRDAARKFQTYITDQVREGMSEPTVGGRTIATWGTQAGTGAGEAVRALMQFKQYPITFIQRSLGREFYRNGVDVGGMATMFANMTALGYAAMTLKELAKGRNPRVPEDMGDYAKIIGASMAQGGGLGLYGDFLFGETSRFGGGILASLGGPLAGNIEALHQLTQDMAKVDSKKERLQVGLADGAALVKSNMPGLNLFYTQAAFNYLVMYRFQEMMNPGYLQRQESRVKKDNNQTFWLRPTGAPSMAAPQVPTIFGGR